MIRRAENDGRWSFSIISFDIFLTIFSYVSFALNTVLFSLVVSFGVLQFFPQVETFKSLPSDLVQL